MYYCSRVYDNFNELMESSHETASMLLKQLDLTLSDIKDEPWANDQLVVYFSIYVSGAYCAIPVIDKYIDLEVFGNVLIDELCADCAQLLPNGKVAVMDCKG